MAKKYNTGLVLSGGAARGFAHLGVLKALEESGIKPDVISAVSAGSIAGAFYADGYTPDEILEIYTSKNLFDLIKITVPKTGFLNANGLKDTLKKNLRAKTIEELKIPMVIAVTNFLKGETEFLTKGNLVDAVMASSCVPVLFEVVKMNDRQYVDGGVLNNMPVEPIEKKCKKLIGVYIMPAGEVKNLKGIVHVAERAFYLTLAAKSVNKKNHFDIFISSDDIAKYGFWDLKKAPELFRLGYDIAMKELKK
ncbi:MAG: patatin-like phospholipase family protein [Bacteroidales bacterium]|nr:patatin-like phospholipase family protein [Bacteroidales bacterium]